MRIPGPSQAWRPAILVLLALLAVSGCRSIRRGEPIQGPMTMTDPKVARGQMVFIQHCDICHPGGEGGLGPSLNDKPPPKFLIKTQVRLGLGAMPCFGRERISADELDDLVEYVVALRKHQPVSAREQERR